MGRCFAKHSMTSSKVCSSVRTGAIAGVFTYATSKQMLSMVGGSLNLRRLKFKAIRDGIPLWRKVFDLLRLPGVSHSGGVVWWVGGPSAGGIGDEERLVKRSGKVDHVQGGVSGFTPGVTGALKNGSRELDNAD